MNQLSTLIEYLLLSHDYVVIPGFGTFIVQQMDAMRNETEETFLPPYRSVRFNSGLNHSDGLIEHTIQEIYGVPEEEAWQMLCAWVNDFTSSLDDEGSLDLGSLGMMTKEEDGTLVFKARESGVTTPDYYGLDVFHLGEVENRQKARIVPIAARVEADDDAITIRINRRVANFVVAACAAIMLFMVFNSPALTELKPEQRSSSLQWVINKTNNADKCTVAEPTVEVNPKTIDVQEQTAAPMPTIETTEPVSGEKVQADYCIVMASAISRTNAERFVQRLDRDGMPNPRIEDGGRIIRVVIGSYATEREAATAAVSVRQKSREYRSAWVLKLRNQ